jgi:chromatin segregation and condensation protein Rec8/ScpA/Scc1 (kleisin family)
MNKGNKKYAREKQKKREKARKKRQREQERKREEKKKIEKERGSIYVLIKENGTFVEHNKFNRKQHYNFTDRAKKINFSHIYVLFLILFFILL